MPLDLSEFDESAKKEWFPLGGQLAGVELLVKYSSPREAEKFRRHLIRQGVLKTSKDGPDINQGRFDDFLQMFSEFYVLDWRGQIKPKDTAYSPELLAKIFAAYEPAFIQVREAVGEAELFFGHANETS